ncbi:6-bladed beta-propeller [Puteibacter caeruleilacunae]|nr:6-bladed beta-propeller [Puteibacter caeruleilacunae]
MIRYYIFLLLLFIGCTNKAPERDFSTMLINPNSGSLKTKLSDIYEPVSAIALETKDACLIENIDKLQLFQDKIYVLDMYGAQSLLVFNSKGQYLFKIGRLGKGPGEYVRPFDFYIDKEDHEIRILTHKKVLVYDLTGNYKRTINLDFSARQFAQVTQDVDCYYGSSKEDRVIVANRQGAIKKTHFQYSPRSRISTPYALQKSGSLCLYNIPNCDTIFSVNRGNILPHIFIDFADAAFTLDDYNSLSEHQKMQTHAYIVESDRYAFKAMYAENITYRFLSFIFHRKTYACIQSNKTKKQIIYDLSDCNDDIWSARTFTQPATITDDGLFVFTQNFPSEILKGKRMLQKKKDNLSPEERVCLDMMSPIYHHINESSNPVLFIAKIKDDAIGE